MKRSQRGFGSADVRAGGESGLASDREGCVVPPAYFSAPSRCAITDQRESTPSGAIVRPTDPRLERLQLLIFRRAPPRGRVRIVAEGMNG